MDLSEIVFWCFHSAEGQAKKQQHQVWGAFRAPRKVFWMPLEIQPGLLYWQILADFSFIYLTTPDTSQSRRILHPLDSEGIPKSTIFVTIIIKSSKRMSMRVSMRVSWNNISWMGFHTKMGGLDKQKQAFRIIPVAKHEFSGSHEI